MSISRIKELPFSCLKVSGHRPRVINLMAQWAVDWIDLQLSRGEEGCLIFDIDDTVVEDNTRVIAPIANIFHSYKNQLNCYFVTARPERLRSETVKMLRELKLEGYADLILMKTRKNDDRSVLSYKYGERNAICEREKKCLLRFGDQIWDVASFKNFNRMFDAIPANDGAIGFLTELGGEGIIKMPARD
jgi:hypothetical protein